MSTDYQNAREALGARLRELRFSRPEGKLTAAQLARLLGWSPAKVSKLENGKQTATSDDLRAWAEGTGQPEVFEELRSRLAGFESHIRSWRRQLAAGHRAAQEAHNTAQAGASVLRAWESSWVVGVLQTPDYARSIFTQFSELHRSPRDLEEAVRARIRRQELLYSGERRYRILLWEGVLRSLVCPPGVLRGQLDRLSGTIGLDTVELGIVPFSASLRLPPGPGFWIYDQRQVVTEIWHSELWLDDAASIATYERVWEMLQETAVYGAAAQTVIAAARKALGAG
ncbi:MULTISPECIES: helix-turn-helix domain-containing protein [Streptomyces]|uniref:Transcriptional regulator n=1 Tax=Streptomyces albus (strain ATCC 21838 / DSM 41398 / FERM P-419 / JCM 4703 / NBRC 107858) TaxID=1081613 RepID=A0A0B5EH85_STRA4|nr:helix-turn-helix transcriptional regulator [Streptomyces sp. SCSIO ZS0520]AJE80764.1 transcriptional regulator [Streptomyces albus]AOU75075.1 transcriptional regulator [Streptomyces albus]AYN30882.1 XRE family transcriptional regulator [Streptomyces albus]